MTKLHDLDPDLDPFPNPDDERTALEHAGEVAAAKSREKLRDEFHGSDEEQAKQDPDHNEEPAAWG